MIKKKSKSKVVKNRFGYIPIELYYVAVLVSINQTDEQFKKSMITDAKLPKELAESFLENTLKRDESHNAHCTWSDVGGIYIIRLYDYSPTPFQYSVITHEAFHATYHILEGKGLQLSDSSEEAFAYLIGHITEKVHKIIK